MKETSDAGSQQGLEIHDQLRLLGGKFLNRTRDQAVQLRECIRDLPNGNAPLTQLEEVAHKIHGSGAMFGFADISACGGEIETLAEALAAATTPIDAATVERLNALVDRLELCVQAAIDAAR